MLNGQDREGEACGGGGLVDVPGPVSVVPDSLLHHTHRLRPCYQRGSGYQQKGCGGGSQCGLRSVTMREALWRRGLWWVCLAATARVAALDVAAGEVARAVTKSEGHGNCEVLNLSGTSTPYSLPTSLTVRPRDAGWQLDFTLERSEAIPVCARLENKQGRLRITLRGESCDDGKVEDYNYLEVSAPLGYWISLKVDVADKMVIVSGQDGRNTSVMTHGPPLPRDGPRLVLTRTRDVEVAVGCSISCPGYRHASEGKDKRKNVKDWSENKVQFYFRPGNEFVKLEYEVACTTSLGPTVFPLSADIKLDRTLPLHLWHLVDLHHDGGLVEVTLDQNPLEKKTLDESCTFKKHTIRVMGDGVFSFSCNPSTGDVEGVEAKCSPVVSLPAAQDWRYGVIIFETILLVLLLPVVVGLGIRHYQMQKQLKRQSEKDSTEAASNA